MHNISRRLNIILVERSGHHISALYFHYMSQKRETMTRICNNTSKWGYFWWTNHETQSCESNIHVCDIMMCCFPPQQKWTKRSSTQCSLFNMYRGARSDTGITAHRVVVILEDDVMMNLRLCAAVMEISLQNISMTLVIENSLAKAWSGKQRCIEL